MVWVDPESLKGDDGEQLYMEAGHIIIKIIIPAIFSETA